MPVPRYQDPMTLLRETLMDSGYCDEDEADDLIAQLLYAGVCFVTAEDME